MGVAEDKAEGVKWYRLAARQGNVGAQRNLWCYETGSGVVRDGAESVRWYRLVQHNLMYYRRGEGVARDPKLAVSYLLLVNAQGNVSSLSSLRQLGVVKGDC